MHFAWSLNPYRGCVHGCHYCYARATHAYFGMNADEDFSTRILVKTNFVDVLRRELARPSWTGERVALGTATDAYQPCEGRYRLTRGVLEALRDFRTPVSIVTKSTLVVRDLDLLAELSRDGDSRVHFTITTVDPHLWRTAEPGTPPPWQRLAAMRRLVAAGVPCGVFMAPVLPGLTDATGAIEAVASAARDHGAEWLWVSPLRLAPLVKEHYLEFVGAAFPPLLPRYQRAYTRADAPPAYVAALQACVDAIRQRYGFTDESAKRVRSSAATPGANRGASVPRQLALAL
jgi:DNA repair photolyase